jgi:hypothetical protein
MTADQNGLTAREFAKSLIVSVHHSIADLIQRLLKRLLGIGIDRHQLRSDEPNGAVVLLNESSVQNANAYGVEIKYGSHDGSKDH